MSNNWPQRGKNNIGNQIIVGLIRRENSTLRQIIIQSCQSLKNLIINDHTYINYCSTDRMTALINADREILIRPQSAYFACPTCLKYNSGNPSTPPPGILNCLMDHSKFGKWIYSALCLEDMFSSWFVFSLI